MHSMKNSIFFYLFFLFFFFKAFPVLAQTFALKCNPEFPGNSSEQYIKTALMTPESGLIIGGYHYKNGTTFGFLWELDDFGNDVYFEEFENGYVSQINSFEDYYVLALDTVVNDESVLKLYKRDFTHKNLLSFLFPQSDDSIIEFVQMVISSKVTGDQFAFGLTPANDLNSDNILLKINSDFSLDSVSSIERLTDRYIQSLDINYLVPNRNLVLYQDFVSFNETRNQILMLSGTGEVLFNKRFNYFSGVNANAIEGRVDDNNIFLNYARYLFPSVNDRNNWVVFDTLGNEIHNSIMPNPGVYYSCNSFENGILFLNILNSNNNLDKFELVHANKDYEYDFFKLDSFDFQYEVCRPILFESNPQKNEYVLLNQNREKNKVYFYRFSLETSSVKNGGKQFDPFKIYPNPFSEIVYVDSPLSDTFIRISDFSGKIREFSLNNGINRIGLNDFSNGLIFYLLYSNDGVVYSSGKLIKVK